MTIVQYTKLTFVAESIKVTKYNNGSIIPWF